ncbi:hypothetical protein ACWIGI_12195 [Nocardia sp. NPDC055321]
MGKVRALPPRYRLWIRLGWVLAVASLGMTVLCFVLAARADGRRCGPDERGDCLTSADAAQIPLILGGGFVLVTVLALAGVLGLRKTLVAAAAAQGRR